MAQQYNNFKPPFRAGPMYGNLGSSPNQQQRPFHPGGNRRMLMRELIIKKISEHETVGYHMGVVPSPLRRGPANTQTNNIRYDGLEQGDPDLAPWVTLRSRFTPTQEVTFPISICANLRKHLLSCADENLNVNGLYSSGDSRHLTPEISVFSVSKLTEIDFQDRAVGCSLRILATVDSSDDEAGNRRCLSSCPINGPPAVSSNGDGASKPMPIHLRQGTLELYEALLPNLVAFLTDIGVRYQTLEQIPQVNFLYSASGERRFFFDVRNTRFGNRLHIAQVTDLHRNVIGIPLESMVDFRDRLSQIIEALHLEDGKDLRDALELRSSRPVRRRLPYASQSITSKPAAAVEPQAAADASVTQKPKPKGMRPNQKPRPKNTPSMSQKDGDVEGDEAPSQANPSSTPQKAAEIGPRPHAWGRRTFTTSRDTEEPKQRRRNTLSASQRTGDSETAKQKSRNDSSASQNAGHGEALQPRHKKTNSTSAKKLEEQHPAEELTPKEAAVPAIETEPTEQQPTPAEQGHDEVDIPAEPATPQEHPVPQTSQANKKKKNKKNKTKNKKKNSNNKNNAASAESDEKLSKEDV